MTVFMVEVLCSLMLLTVLSIVTMAALGGAAGAAVREISLGTGKLIFSRGIVSIRALPLGGFVKFKDTRTEPDGTTEDAYNHKPRLVQAMIPLAGAGVLVLVAMLLRPASAASEIIAGFRQIAAGALSPLSTAQTYIQGAYSLATEQGFIALLGLLAAKTAAFNLLPFPFLNGGQALFTLLRPDRTVTPQWEERVTQFTMLLFLALVAAWLFSLGAFFTGLGAGGS